MRARESVAEFAPMSRCVGINAARRNAEAVQERPRSSGNHNHTERDKRGAREPGKDFANPDRGSEPRKAPVQRAGDHRQDYAQQKRAAP